jgi:hypothetical protein
MDKSGTARNTERSRRRNSWYVSLHGRPAQIKAGEPKVMPVEIPEEHRSPRKDNISLHCPPDPQKSSSIYRDSFLDLSFYEREFDDFSFGDVNPNSWKNEWATERI